jgi:hypothetical protein
MSISMSTFLYQLVQDAKEAGVDVQAMLFSCFDFGEIRAVSPKQLDVIVRGLSKAGTVR